MKYTKKQRANIYHTIAGVIDSRNNPQERVVFNEYVCNWLVGTGNDWHSDRILLCGKPGAMKLEVNKHTAAQRKRRWQGTGIGKRKIEDVFPEFDLFKPSIKVDGNDPWFSSSSSDNFTNVEANNYRINALLFAEQMCKA